MSGVRRAGSFSGSGALLTVDGHVGDSLETWSSLTAQWLRNGEGKLLSQKVSAYLARFDQKESIIITDSLVAVNLYCCCCFLTAFLDPLCFDMTWYPWSVDWFTTELYWCQPRHSNDPYTCFRSRGPYLSIPN